MMADDYIKVDYDIFVNEKNQKQKHAIWNSVGLKLGIINNWKITEWSFKDEMQKYCRADVELLSKTVLKFRKMFIDKLDTDPFRYTTLASLCMGIYMNKFIPEKTIVGNNTEKQDSIVCREWLSYLNNNNICREVPISVKYYENCNIHKHKVGEKLCRYYDCKTFFYSRWIW